MGQIQELLHALFFNILYSINGFISVVGSGVSMF